MKKKVVSLFLLFTMIVGMTNVVNAAGTDQEGKSDWKVTFNAEGKMNANFGVEDFDDPISNMQPGDTVTLSVAVGNEYKEDTKWYMSNEIISSLEDASDAAKNGAYTYRLAYTSNQTGEETVYFDNDTVGGTGAMVEGLHGATESLEKYFFMDDLKTGETGYVTLKITLEGETQNNDYMDTLAALQLNFAVEVVEVQTPPESSEESEPEPPKPPIVVTGDTTNLMPYFIVAGVSGLLFLVLAVMSLKARKKTKEAR